MLIESFCKINFWDYDQCMLCVKDMYIVIDMLMNINFFIKLECFDFVVIYLVGVVNVEGLWDVGMVYCVFVVNIGVWGVGKKVKIGLYVGLGVLGVGLISFVVGGVFWYWLLWR